MKKILMMAFVSAAMLAMVSCSKDKEEEAVSLVGTHWVGTDTFNNIPMIGSIAITADLTFTSETKCNAAVSLVPDLGIDLPQGEFDYTFDGKKMVVVKTNNNLVGDMTLEYQGNTMVYNLPSSIASMAGGQTQFILTKR